LATYAIWKVSEHENVLVECHSCEYRARFRCAGITHTGHFASEIAEEAKDRFGGCLSARLLVRGILCILGDRRADVRTVRAQYRLSDWCWCTMRTLDTTLRHHQQKQ
jgi:hypothetical protein